MKDTFCIEWDLKHGAKLVDFHGWRMAVSYEKGILHEHEVTRTRAGLFNISHMGRVWVTGPDALKFSNYAFTNDLTKTALGSAEYGLLLNERGTIIDDVILYKESPERIFWVVNATNIEKDVEQLKKLAVKYKVQIDNISPKTSMMALQGPLSPKVLGDVVTGCDVNSIPYFGFGRGAIKGHPVTLMATGYTGEDGFEIMTETGNALDVWEVLVACPEVEPCGLGSRDTLRMEAGLPLHGNEIDESTQPTETFLMWAVKLNKEGGFCGKEALNLQPSRKLIGLTLEGAGIPREHYRILSDGVEAGIVTSGVYGPTLKKGIAMGYVKTEFLDKPLSIEIRGKSVGAVRTKPQWVRHVTRKKAPAMV